MRLAIISDMHFGDPVCTMVDYDTLRRGEKYGAFLERAGQNNDYLILLGDTFDFSITDYANAYRIAKTFFRFLKEDKVAKNIIYVSGNHDFDMWHTLEHQINVIHQIGQGRPAREFNWSAPGFIDDRTKSPLRGFQLPGTTGVLDPDQPPRVKMYLNNISRQSDGSGKETNFYFAYPNIYFVSDNEAVLITHGHYLESYWTVVGEWAARVAGDDLKVDGGFDLWQLVAVNFPLCQFACCGVGQAGPLTQLIREVRQEVKDKNLSRVEKYLGRLTSHLDAMTPYGVLNPKEWGSDIAFRYFHRKVLKSIKKFKYARYCEKFIQNKHVMERFHNFFAASVVEINRLNKQYGLDMPVPHHVIFGHTHQPIPWGASDAPRTVMPGGPAITLYNTGGWLWREQTKDRREFCGAEVFTYESNKGFTSHSIR